jgi:tripartite ATP-independent transporter DctM subunit
VIPPSLLLVLAAATTNQSVGRALAGGLVPGVLLTIMLLIPNHIICKRYGYGRHIPFSIGNVMRKFRTCWTAIIAPLIILGSIFSGLVTPTEGAGLAVLYVLIIDVVIFRKIGLRDLWRATKDSAVLTAAVLFIATSSAICNYIVAVERIPEFMTHVLAGMPGGKYGFLAMIIIMVIAIGMFVDATPATLIFTPLFLPIALKMGVDPTHFLVLVSVGMALGLTTPPYGVCLFSISSICKISMAVLVKESLPFYVVMFISLLAVTFIPQISLLLPNLLDTLTAL